MNNNYAGNINTESQPIYKIHNKNKYLLANIHNKNIIYTETTPDTTLLEKYTIIYSPTPDKAIIKNATTRFETTRSKALMLLTYNKPLTVQFNYYSFTDNYPSSIQNIHKQLITHNTDVKLIDLTHDYTLIIRACASGTEDYVPDLNWDIYKDTIRPYYKLLKQEQALNQQLSYIKPKPINPLILQYIHIWAPAYQIDIPQPPVESLVNFLPETIYNRDIMTLYTQLKAYEQYDLEITDDYTICSNCKLPYHTHEEFCPHCDYSDFEAFLELED